MKLLKEILICFNHALKFSQNPSINVTKIARIMLHNVKITLYNIEKVLILSHGKPSTEFDGIHLTVPEGTPSLTLYTKAGIRDGYIIPHESKVYHKSEKFELFRKQNWFGAAHPNVQVDAKLDYMISRVLLKMDHTSLNIYKKLTDLDRDLKQTAFILLTQKFPLVGYVITGQRHTFATLKSQSVISLFQCKIVSSPLYVLKDQCFQRIPIHYQNKLQFVDRVTRKTFPWSIIAPCKPDNFDQQISLDADGDDTSRNILPNYGAKPTALEFSRLTK